MTIESRQLITLAAMLLIWGWPLFAHAASNTGNLSVSVTVPAVVQVSVSTMDFGNTYNTQDTLQSSATISINILSGQAYNITLDAGLHFSTERRLSDGAGNFRQFFLYQDSARTTLWGDSAFTGSYNSGNSVAATGTGVDQTFTVYGESPGVTGTFPEGAYTDSVTVTINY